MEAKQEQELVFFSTKFNPDDYDNKPLPFDVFHQSGAFLATKGTKISKEKLKIAFVKSNDLPETDGSGQTVVSKDERLESFLSEAYQEEKAEVIEARLEEIDFEPVADVKKNLRKNIYEIKEIFQKKIIDNTIQLSSKNNPVISKNIASYLRNIIQFPAHASDYIEMIQAVKNEENYITFSHGLSVSFYAVAIAKKLQMLRDDFCVRENLGRWLPIKTLKNPKIYSPQPFSNQLLKYIDNQVFGIRGKYKAPVAQLLTERLYDTMHEYLQIKPGSMFQSFRPAYDLAMEENLVVAAINSDIGKLCLPNSLLNKPESLTEEEWKNIKEHPINSVAKLKEIGNHKPQPLVYILGHHNFSNKIGYPIFNKALPEESKIISVADIYDAMTSRRHYAQKKSHSEAINYIKELYEKEYIDFPLYITAVHTFDEYNHEYIRERNKKTVSV